MSFLMSSSHLFFGLPSGRVNIGFHFYTFFLPLSLPAFVVSGQTSLIFVLPLLPIAGIKIPAIFRGNFGNFFVILKCFCIYSSIYVGTPNSAEDA